MTVGMGNEFLETMTTLGKMPDLRAVILTGAGRAFSAGGDASFLRARIADTPENNVQEMRRFYSRFLSLRDVGVPVIAALHGPAVGAGFCVALASDLRVVHASSKYAVNFVRIGIHPGMGATYSLPRLVGHAAASSLLLTGESITGTEAHRLGLATACCETPEAVVAKAQELALAVGTGSATAVRETLKTLRGSESALAAALQREAEAQAVNYAEARDLDEALNALKARRAPVFPPAPSA
jgi:enoyl-CoA hydratase/carnithine racemase